MKKQKKDLKIALIDCKENSNLDSECFGILKKDLKPKVITDLNKALENLSFNKNSIYLLAGLPDGQDPYKFFFLAKKNGFQGNFIFLVNEKIDEITGDVPQENRPAVDFLKTGKLKPGKARVEIQKILDNPVNKKNSKDYLNLKTIFESLSIMFYVESYEPNYHFEYLSPAFEYLGYKLEDFYADNQLLNKITEPSDYELMMEKNQEIYDKSKDETDYEYRVYTKDGRVRWWKDCGRPIFDENGEKVKWFGVIYDITDRKSAEIAIKENEKKYRELLESLPLMIYKVQSEYPYSPFYVSQTVEQLGYPLEEWYSNRKKWEEIIHPEDAETVLNDTREAKEKGKKTDLQYRVLTKDGEVRWIHDCGQFVFDERGKKEFWQGYMVDITQKKETELALQESEKKHRDLIQNAHDMIYQHDLEGNLKTINKAVKRISGYSVEEALKLNMRDFIVPEHLEKANRQVMNKLQGKSTKPYELDVIGKDEKRVSLEINSRLIYKDEEPFMIEGIARDITQRKRLLSELDRFYNLSFDILATLDFQANIIQVNPTWEKVLGHSAEKVLNTSLIKFIHPDDVEKTVNFVEQTAKGEAVSFEVRMRCQNGDYRWFEWGSIPVLEDRVSYAVARDVTDRKETEQKLEYNALHDSLTGLPNRKHFLKHLDLAIERAKIEARFKFAVLFIDLDRFKVVNDSLGHVIGDKLLIRVADTLKECVRPSDVIARLGGDEFTVLITLKDLEDAEKVANRIQEKIGVPFEIENYEVFTSASVGIIISDNNPRKSEEFLRDADTAMYRAKDSGKARYEIYRDEMHARNINLLQTETDLRRAIEESEFRVFYQPIVDLETGEVREFESLIRWQHPEKGLIFPDQFIGVAEETGLIIPIGSWVIEESCRQILEWEKRLNLPLQISINLSAKQLMHPFLVKKIEKVITDLNINPEKIKLEVTESTVMDNTDVALKAIKDLNQIGVRLSTDDFGTGYSSLSYLHLFPFERIKIDRSFVGQMDTDFKREGIVRSIMMLGQNLEIDIVAEGIENEDQLWQLRSLGCKLGQGWLFSKAVDAREAERILKEGLDFNFDNIEVPFAFSSDFNSSSSINLSKPV